jgi:hypothetical protein
MQAQDVHVVVKIGRGKSSIHGCVLSRHMVVELNATEYTLLVHHRALFDTHTDEYLPFPALLRTIAIISPSEGYESPSIAAVLVVSL